MIEYNKPPLSVEDQIKLLEKRGLSFTNKEQAKTNLSNISYYRISPYTTPFKKIKNDEIQKDFKDNTTWEMIFRLYEFDHKLRLLIFSTIEHIEIAVRTQITNQLSDKYGSHWQDDENIFKPPFPKTLNNGDSKTIDIYKEIQSHIQNQLNDDKAEIFIKHYKNKYNKPTNPPSWMIVETITFGVLSRIYKNLKNYKDKQLIADYFKLPHKVFSSWIHSIHVIRNICAHHSRLWNKVLDVAPMPFKNKKSRGPIWINQTNTNNNGKGVRIYYILCMLNYLLQTINPTYPLKNYLKELLTEYKDVIYLNAMGFPNDWENENMWK